MAEQRIIPIADVRLDGGTQMRVALDETVVADYAQTIQDGKDLDPIVVFYDGKNIWPGDGFHRIHGYLAAGAVEIDAEVHDGSQRDAILYAAGANARHGLLRTTADKRKAVQTLLSDEEWSQWPQTKIAEACGVSQPFVSRLVAELGDGASYSLNKMRVVERNGTTYEQDTSNIGKGRPAVADDPEAKAVRQAQQAENERQRDEAKASLPEAVRNAEAARQAAIANRRAVDAGDGLTPDDRVDELQETVRHLQASVEAMQADAKLFGQMRVQWEQGGFEKVVADKDETIRVLKVQFENENREKIDTLKSMKRWKKRAEDLGWTRDVVIPATAGGGRNG